MNTLAIFLSLFATRPDRGEIYQASLRGSRHFNDPQYLGENNGWSNGPLGSTADWDKTPLPIANLPESPDQPGATEDEEDALGPSKGWYGLGI